MLLQSLRLGLLLFKLIAEETNLGLRLLPGTFRLGDLLLLLLVSFHLFCTERLQIATKDLGVFADAFQLRLEYSDGPSNVCLFHHHAVLFLFCPLELVGLTRKRMSEFFDLDEMNVQLLASVFMRFLRRCVLVPKLMGPLAIV